MTPTALSRPWQRLRQRVEARLPALTRLKQPESLPIVLHRRRIYIVPTGFGIGFAVMLAVMLVGALNYANNAALLLTCLLGGVTVNSMLGAFRALDGLGLDAIRPGTARAGQPLHVVLDFAADPRSRSALRLDGYGETQYFATTAGVSTHIQLLLATTHRGWQALPRLRITSTWPYGMFRAWSWMHPQQSVLVYPRPEDSGPPPHGESDTSPRMRPRDGDELASLRAYRVGDPMKLVAWKASARHHELLVRDFERPAVQHEYRLEWTRLHDLDSETRIARLARWVGEAHEAGRRWSLVLPGQTLGPGGGSEHFHRCMTALALMP